MTNKEFAEKNAGKYFRFRGYRDYKVRVIWCDRHRQFRDNRLSPRMADRGHQFCGRYSRGVVRDREMLLCTLGGS